MISWLKHRLFRLEDPKDTVRNNLDDSSRELPYYERQAAYALAMAEFHRNQIVVLTKLIKDHPNE